MPGNEEPDVPLIHPGVPAGSCGEVPDKAGLLIITPAMRADTQDCKESGKVPFFIRYPAVQCSPDKGGHPPIRIDGYRFSLRDCSLSLRVQGTFRGLRAAGSSPAGNLLVSRFIFYSGLS